MPVITVASWAALAAIVIIGLDMLLRSPKRREDGGRPAMLPGDVDPASLRQRRPAAQRLSGAVLILAALVIFFVLRPVIAG